MTEAETASITDDIGEPIITDVWSRTTSKYRVRATVLLIVNMILFAGLGCFAYWLRTGHTVAPATGGYWTMLAETFMPRGDATLANFVHFPISLEVVPAHGVVVGLLLAALVSIPILIAILYRLPASLPFILVVGFLAAMPWLAINLAGACVLATIKPLRFRFRYASALLGLLLVLLYFYGASRQTTPLVDAYKPEDRIKFMAPWILATLASCVIMGGVLFLAKMVNYRPGVVAPLLLVSFAVPVLVFEQYVGRDELQYRLLEHDFKSRFQLKEHQVDHDVSEWFERIARQHWEAEPYPRPPYEAIRERVEFRIALELEAEANRRSVFAAEREKIANACDRFVRFYPDSRYAPNVLYLKAQTLDMRIDVSAFRNEKVIRYYDDFPTPQSEIEWRRVLANAPTSAISALGRHRLAIFEARNGRFDEALALLDELIELFNQGVIVHKTPEPTGIVKGLLASRPAAESLSIRLDLVVSEARLFRSLLRNNGKDPVYGLRPFCGSLRGEPHQAGLLQLDPRYPQYSQNLQSILDAYPRCLLGDNIALRLAMLATNFDEKARRLEACIATYAYGDVRPEALFRLGVAQLENGIAARGRANLQRLVQEHPNNALWTQLAEDRLRTLPSAALENDS